ncbi:hypothetical protein C1645_871848 [Glomus cerebriforme]|uniref:BTB domain-containing protein n=1 Tax=Glomus cerebriforme TaxID=658196 RepID=A0A397TFR6_9GLOM|nr:hypothetical protein C1645_871848 [Glomus cerebriforme]
MVDDKLLPKLSQNLLEILNDDEYYDVTIEVGNDPYVKIFRAHMVILNYRSPFLRRILSTNKKKNDGTLTNIKLPNILPESFQIVLRYIYGGRLSLEEYGISDIIKILVTANELSLQELIPYLESYLIENKTNWMEQNFNLIYQTCFENNSFLKLQKYCTDLISKEPNKIFNLPNFSLIPENLLISLIQNNNLQISEIQVWKHVLEWGLAQNPELSSDPSSYSNEDFKALKNTLRNCIPFIKFTKFTSKEFLNKAYPYKKIIPEEIYDNIFKYFLDYDCNSGENDKHIEKDDVVQYNLGQYYRHGKGVEKDEVKAFEYYKKSADQGHLNAQFQLGHCYDYGIGTEVNKAKAFELYKIVAEKGHIIAQNNLGTLYENGEGIEKDLEKAINWFNKAAENGNNEALYNLGRCYGLGIGVEKNIVKAFECCKIAAEKGHDIAQNSLGILYADGEGTEKDLEKAIYWLQKAAENGNNKAKYNLGQSFKCSISTYSKGIGTEINKVKAFEYYEVAAENGHSDAQNSLGRLYKNGEGTEKNSEKAAYWFQKATERIKINKQS